MSRDPGLKQWAHDTSLHSENVNFDGRQQAKNRHLPVQPAGYANPDETSIAK